jgi:uncharacterized protein YbaR (Trm112 family)
MDYFNRYCSSLADIINKLDGIGSIVEAGVGEATTLSTLLKYLNNIPEIICGFDISWSRVKFAKTFLNEQVPSIRPTLCTGDLFEIPLPDNSVDLVFTSHAIEPNGGREREALIELHRITRKYMVLLEPAYEFASQEGRDRMHKHGYITKLYETARNLGYNILEHRLFECCTNPQNPTGLIIIEKRIVDSNEFVLSCPITKSRLQRIENALYAPESLLAYPILQDIPCLLPQNAIIAAHF